MSKANLSKNEQALLADVDRLARRYETKSSGIRRILTYISAIYRSGEGAIVEKDLEDYFDGLVKFGKIEDDYSNRTIVFRSNDGILPDPPLTHLLLGQSPRRGQ